MAHGEGTGIKVFGDDRLTDMATCETAKRENSEEGTYQSVREIRLSWHHVLSQAHDSDIAIARAAAC